MRFVAVLEPLLLYGAALAWAYSIGATVNRFDGYAMLAGEIMLACGLVAYWVGRHRA